MITPAERDALDEGIRRARANGHRLGDRQEGLTMVVHPCLGCGADVALAKGSTDLSGEALTTPCNAGDPEEAPCK